MTLAKNINPYLVDADNVFIVSRKTPISDVPKMYIGCEMKDDGNYVMTEDEKNTFLQNEPQAEKYIHPYMMGKDFIARKSRYCLWLKEVYCHRS
ncbi:MAG: type IIL restriction-modification enzyme MmeI [Anaerobutyricum sp.]